MSRTRAPMRSDPLRAEAVHQNRARLRDFACPIERRGEQVGWRADWTGEARAGIVVFAVQDGDRLRLLRLKPVTVSQRFCRSAAIGGRAMIR